VIASTTMGRTSSGVIVLAWLAWPVDASAECAPTAVTTGEPALVQRLTERLAVTGIASAEQRDCPVTRVRIDQRGEAIHVAVIDAYGRRGERDVHDVATAATIVESWMAQEVEAGSLPPLSATASSPPAPAAPHSRAVALALESSAGGDGSLWLGAAATGSVAIGAVCVGGLLRAARDALGAGDSSMIDHTTDAIEALATIGVPLRAAGFTITPGLGVGYGYHRLVEHHHDAHMNLVDVDYADHALRGDLHVSIARRLAGPVAMFVDVRGDTALLASGDVPYGASSFVRLSLGMRLGGGD
jgi:hypothetical protein